MTEKKIKSNYYFDEPEEEAVVDFLNAKTQSERSEIYSKRLAKAFEKLVESIINKYKLHRINITYEENFADTLSYLIQQTGMFKPEKNKKAYSYYGTICRNYLIAEIKKDQKKMKINTDFDVTIPKLEEEMKYVYVIDEEGIKTKELIANVITEITYILDNRETIKKKLNENEVKLGSALVEILSNWELFLGEETSTSKFDKVTIISTIRTYTNLSTKDIRVALKRYKEVFKTIKNTMIMKGSI